MDCASREIVCRDSQISPLVRNETPMHEELQGVGEGRLGDDLNAAGVEQMGMRWHPGQRIIARGPVSAQARRPSCSDPMSSPLGGDSRRRQSTLVLDLVRCAVYAGCDLNQSPESVALFLHQGLPEHLLHHNREARVRRQPLREGGLSCPALGIPAEPEPHMVLEHAVREDAPPHPCLGPPPKQEGNRGIRPDPIDPGGRAELAGVGPASELSAPRRRLRDLGELLEQLVKNASLRLKGMKSNPPPY